MLRHALGTFGVRSADRQLPQINGANGALSQVWRSSETWTNASPGNDRREIRALTLPDGLWARFVAPVPAIPVDLFRIGVGLTSAAYFVRTFREASEFSGPDGLIDHRLVRECFWFTKIGFYFPGIPLSAFRVIDAGAVAASLMLAAGWRSRPLGLALFATAASTYRWNFPVTYLDDALMHIMLLWTALLPTGRTLVLTQWLRERDQALNRWAHASVPGAAVRCFLGNLSLMYLVAGLWKWTSPLWRDGIAVYAGLKTAVAYTPDRWRPDRFVVALNHLSLLLEPLFPLLYALPTRHPLKYGMALAVLGFHGGILATLKIPFAQALCLASTPIALREEIAGFLAGRFSGSGPIPPPPSANLFGYPERIAACLVAWLAIAMASDAARPRWRSGTHPDVHGTSLADRCPAVRQNPFYGLLWFAGIAQSYRLFDWIDERNYHIAYTAIERLPDGSARAIDDTLLFPRRQRHVLLQSYLHDVMWMKVPRSKLPRFQASLFDRYARRYCQLHPPSGRVEVVAEIQRTTRENLDLSRPMRIPFVSFSCESGVPVVHSMNLVKN